MDIYNFSGRFGYDPKKADGTSMGYKEQCAYIAGCLDVWFSLLHAERASLAEIAETMRMTIGEAHRMYILWLNSTTH